MSMKAVVLHEVTDLSRDREPLRYGDEPAPEPSEREILIKVLRVSY